MHCSILLQSTKDAQLKEVKGFVKTLRLDENRILEEKNIVKRRLAQLFPKEAKLEARLKVGQPDQVPKPQTARKSQLDVEALEVDMPACASFRAYLDSSFPRHRRMSPSREQRYKDMLQHQTIKPFHQLSSISEVWFQVFKFLIILKRNDGDSCLRATSSCCTIKIHSLRFHNFYEKNFIIWQSVYGVLQDHHFAQIYDYVRSTGPLVCHAMFISGSTRSLIA
ncbi:uncharacterized protein E5676_scaffold1312G00200 [Cucumis melo var. makuwa]|uniref:Uncharacterized protein n=1 Tax=Cucumis melo var. makuwa TaxID=1194695 RepID=A0A5D3DC84_CUCMM|nr:uncharacterized protein E5676_scaffold1312G00200 [Cucumis melo var. makuwa]